MEIDYKYIESLTQVDSISGHEEEVRELLYNRLKEYSDSIEFDNLGSIIFKKGNDGPRVMIAAHIDQIGFVITNIDEDGFCYFKPIGGWYPAQLMTQEVSVTTEDGKKYIGVIGHKPVPFLKKKSEIEMRDLFIDFGVDSKEELENCGIEVGNPLTPVSTFKRLCNPKYIATKAWDNRVGCGIIAELLRGISKDNREMPCRLNLVGSVQEEVGLRGGTTSSHMVNPDISIAIDIGAYGDTPGVDPYDSTLKLGKGPSIQVLDAVSIGNKKLIKLMKKLAIENGIPYQVDVMLNGGTDNGPMHRNGDGAFGVTICIPTRYGHSHNSIIHSDDLENAIRLLRVTVENLTEEFLKELKTFV